MEVVAGSGPDDLDPAAAGVVSQHDVGVDGLPQRVERCRHRPGGQQHRMASLERGQIGHEGPHVVGSFDEYQPPGFTELLDEALDLRRQRFVGERRAGGDIDDGRSEPEPGGEGGDRQHRRADVRCT